jgi:N6-adenosine-specific RNA methylase IME4
MGQALVPSNVNVNEQLALFDERPITLEGYTLRARGVQVTGRPSIKHWQAALAFACAAHESSPYWVGDLIAHAESRQEWNEKLDQAISITRLARGTLLNLGYISRRVDEEARELSPSIEHSKEVAPMPPARQRRWLEKAKTEGWTVRELRVNIRASQRAAIIEGQAHLSGMFRFILADPPWLYQDSGPTADGSLGKAARRFPGMSIERMMQLPVAAHAMPVATLGMWVTAPFVYPEKGPGPRELAEAWGFLYKAQFVWHKVLGMPGHQNHVCHENLFLFTRGADRPDVPTPQPKSVITIRRGEEWEHSQKPEEVQQMIERHWTTGPYLELFGRRKRTGWTVFGNDARLWAKQMEKAG